MTSTHARGSEAVDGSIGADVELSEAIIADSTTAIELEVTSLTELISELVETAAARAEMVVEELATAADADDSGTRGAVLLANVQLPNIKVELTLAVPAAELDEELFNTAAEGEGEGVVVDDILAIEVAVEIDKEVDGEDEIVEEAIAGVALPAEGIEAGTTAEPPSIETPLRSVRQNWAEGSRMGVRQ
jgi:hypothetical protein